MYLTTLIFGLADVCIDCVITKAVAVYVSSGYYTMIHLYDIPEVVYYQLLCFWRSGLLKTQHHGEKIVLVKFEREIRGYRYTTFVRQKRMRSLSLFKHINSRANVQDSHALTNNRSARF